MPEESIERYELVIAMQAGAWREHGDGLCFCCRERRGSIVKRLLLRDWSCLYYVRRRLHVPVRWLFFYGPSAEVERPGSARLVQGLLFYLCCGLQRVLADCSKVFLRRQDRGALVDCRTRVVYSCSDIPVLQSKCWLAEVEKLGLTRHIISRNAPSLLQTLLDYHQNIE